MSIVVMGEALIDEVRRGDDVTEHVGGGCLNIACGLARLGHEAHLACWIGPDTGGALIREYTAAAGVALTPGSMNAARTPRAQALLDASGAATYTFDFSSDLADFPTAGVSHVHCGSIATVIEPGATKILDAVRELWGQATVSYDPNVRPALAGERAAARNNAESFVAVADVVKASDEDVAWLYPDLTLEQVAQRWLSQGPALVVITRGGDGAMVVLASGDIHHVPTLPTQVVDTVGAGDSFMAGLISGLTDAGFLGEASARGRLKTAAWAAIEPAIARAIATSRITVQHAGAYGPTRDEIV